MGVALKFLITFLISFFTGGYLLSTDKSNDSVPIALVGAILFFGGLIGSIISALIYVWTR